MVIEINAGYNQMEQPVFGNSYDSSFVSSARADLLVSSSVGRPRVNITRSDLEDLYFKYKNWQFVADYFGVSRMTIMRRVKEYGLTKCYK